MTLSLILFYKSRLLRNEETEYFQFQVYTNSFLNMFLRNQFLIFERYNNFYQNYFLNINMPLLHMYVNQNLELGLLRNKAITF